MALITTTDTATVVRLAEAAVAAEPVANTVYGSIASGAQQSDAAPWAAHPSGSPLVLAARSQPYTTVGFTTGWTDLAPVSDAIGRLDPAAAGVAGPPATVSAVADGLGLPVTRQMDERLFRLDELVPPRPVVGSARIAGDGDARWLARWYVDFAVEAFGRLPPGFDATLMVERGVVQSRCWIWSDGGGAPRSFAVAHAAVHGVSRIGPVYTPPDARGRGFGSAATAAATADILGRGDVACLYTDLANATSNKIYQDLGFRRVLDRTTVRFD
ncbi:MAG: GNAT family N-acetyltransferase [Jatrophihabitantaceae bacterium]